MFIQILHACGLSYLFGVSPQDSVKLQSLSASRQHHVETGPGCGLARLPLGIRLVSCSFVALRRCTRGTAHLLPLAAFMALMSFITTPSTQGI